MASARTFRQVVKKAWTEEIQRTQARDVDAARVIEIVLQDPALTQQAVAFAVDKIRGEVDLRIRQQLTKTSHGTPDHPLVDSLIEHGLSLLDARFGRTKLGDYLPDDLVRYAEQKRSKAVTALVRASFVRAVASACPDKDRPIRQQLSAEQIEALRDRIIRRAPSPEVAEEALAG